MNTLRPRATRSVVKLAYVLWPDIWAISPRRIWAIVLVVISYYVLWLYAYKHLLTRKQFSSQICDKMVTIFKLILLKENCSFQMALEWRHNERHGVSNHRLLDCFLNRLFRRTPKKTSKRGVPGLREGNPPVTCGFPSQRASNADIMDATVHYGDVTMGAMASRWPVNSPHKWPITRKMFPFDDVIMECHVVSNHRQLDGFLSPLFQLIS